MLENLRESLKKFGWIIAAIICIPFVLTGADYFFVGGSATESAIVVNGETISTSSIQRAVVRQQQQLRDQYGPEILQQLTDDMLRNQVLGQLVQQKVLVQAAAERGMGVAKSDVDSIVRGMPAFEEDGTFSNEQFQYVIRRNGHTSKSFLQGIKEDVLVQQLASGLIVSGFTSELELAQTAAVTEQQRNVYYLTIPAVSLLDSVQVNEAAIEERYSLSVQDYAIPEQLEVEYIDVSVDSMLAAQEISDDLVQQRFSAEVAALESGVEQPLFATERVRIEKELREELAEEKYLILIEELKDRVFSAESLQEPAEALGLTRQVSQPFSRSGGAGVAEFPQLVEAAFGDDVLLNGYASEVIELSESRAVVLKLLNRIPERVQPLDEVTDQVKAILAQELSGAQAVAKGQELRQRIIKGEALMDVAKAEGLDWQVSPETRFRGGNLADDIRTTAFSLPVPKNGPIVQGFSRDNGDYILLSLQSVEYGSTDSLSGDQSDTLKKGIDLNNAQKSTQAYQNWLMQRADIEVGG